MKVPYQELKKVTHAFYLLAALTSLAPATTLAQTAKAQMAVSGSLASGSELETSVVLFHAGIRDLDRTYADLPYTVLIDKKKAYLKEWQDQLQKQDFAALNQQAKVDFLLLLRNSKRYAYELAQQQDVWASMQPALPFAGKINELGWLRHNGTTPDAVKVAATLEQIGQEITKAGQNLPKINLKAVNSLPQAMAVVTSLRRTLNGFFSFYDGYHPAFTWWVTKPYQKTDALLAIYADSLKVYISRNQKSTDQSGIPGVAVGRATIEQSLVFEMIRYSPEELIEIAQKEYAWCLKEAKKASAEMGLKDDWRAALEKVKNDYLPAGEQPAFIRKLSDEAVAYVEAKQLLEVPALAKNTWTMEMMTPERQLVNPFFTGGDVISISYPTNTMAYQDQLMSMRGNNIHFAKATVFHELIPGHYLQSYMLERYKPYRRPFYTPFWEEGWAFYWEMLLWDQGFHATPEDKVGALFWRMHRCARIIFSLNFHLGKWTPGQCVEYLIDSVGHERANAEGEVRRSFAGDYDPLYQLAYMIGALQFRSLRHELVESGQMTDIAFHNAILQQHALPIEMIRALLKNTTLSKDFKPEWKFYEEIARK